MGKPGQRVARKQQHVRRTAAARGALAGHWPSTPVALRPRLWACNAGLTIPDLLNRKLMFKKGTMPAKKLEEMGPIIKELK